MEIGSTKALGYGAFGLLAWTYAVIWAGWFPEAAFGTGDAFDVALIATYALLVAALGAFLRGETWEAVFFMFWSACAWALQVQIESGTAGNQLFRAWLFLVISCFHGVLAWGAASPDRIDRRRFVLALGTGTCLLCFSLAEWGLGPWIGVVGGYATLFVSLFGFWRMAEAIGALRGSTGPAEP